MFKWIERFKEWNAEIDRELEQIRNSVPVSNRAQRRHPGVVISQTGRPGKKKVYLA